MMPISLTKSTDFLMIVICLVAIVTVLHESYIYADMESSTTTPSPLKQFQSGIAAKDVICNKGLALILSATDGSPACVRSVSITRLFSQGWAEKNFVGISAMTLNNASFNKIGPDPSTLTAHNRLVFFVKPNSTAQIYVKYNSSTTSMPDTLEAEYGVDGTTPSSYISDLSVHVIPESVDLQSADITAIYAINVQNITGMYWINFPDRCDYIPIAVGLNSSQINPSDIAIHMGTTTCPSHFMDVTILGISGGTAEYKLSERLQ